MATWRLVRCNPWSHGGVDYVRVNEKKKENHNSKNEKKEEVTLNG
jgi:putative component of membrane protein insertase Oxa1/YidC/SpoIIIJ protein YidD